MAENKLQIAIYWGAACGGCDVSILDTNEFILEVDAAADVRLWPIAADGKYKDVEAMADGELDVVIMNGAVRNSENEEIARLLRQKTKVFVAYGSCAYMGGIPSLANLVPRAEIFERAYLDNPSIEPGNRTVPKPLTSINGYELEIPEFYDRVFKLDQVVDVDLLRARLPAGARPGQGGDHGVGPGPDGSGRSPSEGRDRRGLRQGPVRRLSTHEEREDGDGFPPAVGDPCKIPRSA